MRASASPSRPGLKPDGSRDEELKLPIRPGDTVADKYVVEGMLGTGGVGVVVSARHTKLGERVAIKFLQTSAMKSAENIERFDREARAAARIKSEHVARVMDFGALPNGAPYMVLEHLDGLDLGALLRSQGRVPFQAAVDYVVQACEAVVEAHALGIVHRDLKPANLFLAKRHDGSAIVKVLDFGISKLLGKDGSPIDLAMTQTSSVIGSPLYMSPEQMQSPKDANELSDIWSLGVILYELMAGAAPFEAATMPLLCAKICCGDPTPLSSRFKDNEPEPPVELEAAIMVCLQRDPGQRPGNVAELVRLIAPFGSPDSLVACERITRVATQAGMFGNASYVEGPSEPSLPRISLASLAAQDARVRGSIAPRSEGRHWSWSPGRPLGNRVGSRNLALLGFVLAAGFGLGAWGMNARSAGHPVSVRAGLGREVVLASRTALISYETKTRNASAPSTDTSPSAEPMPADSWVAVDSASPLASAAASAEPSSTPRAASEGPKTSSEGSIHRVSRPQPAAKPAVPKPPAPAETTDVLRER